MIPNKSLTMGSPARQIDAALASATPELRAVLVAGIADGHPPGGAASLAGPAPWAGVMHEVFAAPAGGQIARFGTHHPPPAGLLIAWASHQLAAGRGRLAVWVGRRVWPYPLVLERAGLLGGSLFVDAQDNNQRLWAAELALRSPAVACVVADGSGLGMPATRRLQLIARQSQALMLLARPSHDERQLSAAGARWRVGVVSSPDSPQWKVELLRCKGVRPVSLGTNGHSHPAWTLRWEAESASMRVIDTDVEHDQRDPAPGGAPAPPRPAFPPRAATLPGGLPADLADGPDHAARPAPIRRTG